MSCFLMAPCLAQSEQSLQLGENIYQQGQTQSGQAWLSSSNSAEEPTSIPSAMVPCVNCHGERGGGSREGGILAPAIRWHSLAMATGAEQHYNQSAFSLAVSEGIGRNGQPLNASMPRYLLSPAELSAMIAYLKVIDSSHPAGVTSTQIKLQLLLPKDAELAEAMRETIQDYLDLLNHSGGIYGRSLKINRKMPQLKTMTAESIPTFITLDLRTTVAEPLQFNQPVSSPFVISLFADQAIEPGGNNSIDSYALYPHPKNYQALKIETAEQRGWKHRLVNHANLAEVIAEQHSLEPVEQSRWALIPTAGQLELLTLFKILRVKGIQTNILVDMQVVSTEVRKAAADYPGAIFTLLPPGVEAVTEDGQRTFAKLSSSPQRYQNWLQQRLWALSTARLLETSLQQSGRNLTLRGFGKAMQSQVDLVTDFGPSLSYSANRRIGSLDVSLQRIN